MSDERPNESIDDSTTIQPVPEVPAPTASDVVAQPLPGEPAVSMTPAYTDPLASAAESYDPQPLQVSEATSRNWMGITALITAILGFVVIPIVFAILGLSAVKEGKATNKGLNVAAIIISLVWVVLFVLFMGAFFAWLSGQD